ncbi:hypothetical protein A0256_03180 [Mucilaginibacter sp. PAMC 26640]|nr:hypothetical protein A0256_03180 [Mucilaginibacter sp. PAMC 26640]
MSKHHGQIIEYAVRRAGYNLSELAKALGVNRRTLYNWFQMPRLRPDLIYRIGKIVRHDFSTDFPELLTSDLVASASPRIQESILNDEIWKDKYISLLEKYNHHLSQKIKTDINSFKFPD